MNSALQINIKKHLAKQKMSAAELERRTGIPHAVVNILHGRSKNPSLRTAQAIARELGCTVEELFSEQADPLPTGAWDANLFKKSADAICKEIATHKVEASVEKVAACVCEVYAYTKGSPMGNIDARFVSWIVQKNIVDLTAKK